MSVCTDTMYSGMERAHLYQITVAVLLVVISCGVVNSLVTDFKNVNNEVLFSQIQEDQLSLAEGFSKGATYYLLVLKINEAVLRGILTRVPNEGHEVSGIYTDLYTAHGYSGQLRLPSTDEINDAKHYFIDNAEQPAVDRFGSINSESRRFIQGEHERYNEDRPTAQGTFGPQNGRQPLLGQNLGRTSTINTESSFNNEQVERMSQPPDGQGGPRDNLGYGGNDLDEETDDGCFGKLFSCFKRRH